MRVSSLSLEQELPGAKFEVGDAIDADSIFGDDIDGVSATSVFRSPGRTPGRHWAKVQ